MKCTICDKPIILSPSAKERAQKFGGKPSDYTALFTAHAACQVRQRSVASTALMLRLSKGE